MRLTMHNGRNGYARHNDRQFDYEKAEHIDAEKTKQNLYYCCYKNMPFQEAELKFYYENYGADLQRKNENYLKQRHAERVKTIEQIYEDKKTRPMEQIFQIGSRKDGTIDGRTFNKCLHDYLQEIQRWSMEHNNCLHVLSVAVHNDETTPHAHIRFVFDYEENGLRKLGQNEALKRAGIEPPEPSKKISRFNNRITTATQTFRTIAQDICRGYGVELITEPLPHKPHKEKEEFIEQQIAEKHIENERLTTTKTELQHEIISMTKSAAELSMNIDAEKEQYSQQKSRRIEAEQTAEQAERAAEKIRTELSELEQKEHEYMEAIKEEKSFVDALKEVSEKCRQDIRKYQEQKNTIVEFITNFFKKNKHWIRDLKRSVENGEYVDYEQYLKDKQTPVFDKQDMENLNELAKQSNYYEYR